MLARAINLIVIVLEIRSIPLSSDVTKLRSLVFYTRLSNIVTLVSSLLLVIFGQPEAVTIARYLSTCMMVMTFFVTTCVLVPMGAPAKKLLWSGSGLYHHILCPMISTASYILFEKHAGYGLIWLPAVITLVYGLVMLFLNAKEIVDGPYPFFRVRNQSVKATVLWMIVLFAAVTAISAAVWFVSTFSE